MNNREWIPHSTSSVGAAETQAVQEVIGSNFIGYGTKAAEVERKVSGATGRKHAFAVSSGFHALALAVRSLDLPRPSLIALPVLTCPSLLAAVQGAGHQAWLADIQEADLTIDPRAISRDAAAVIAPHAYGAPVDSRALEQLGRPWIEDCASLPAGAPAGRPVGSSGTLAVFSFDSTKCITGGSGGMVLTDGHGLARRICDLLDSDRFEKRGEWTSGIPASLPGRLADLNAAVALVQWGRLPEFTERRRAIAGTYQKGLEALPGLSLPTLDAEHGFYRYIVRTSDPAATLASALREHGIDARHSVNPWLHRVTSSVLGGPWPVADRWCEHLLSLPIHPQLTDEEVHRIVKTLTAVLKKSLRSMS